MPAAEVLYTITPSNDSTLAIELVKTGLMRRKKHILFFEKFSGNLRYTPHHPESSRVDLVVDAHSIVCRDSWLKSRKQQRVTAYARDEALSADRHPEIRFSSTRICSKPLRGFVVEGELKIRGVGRIVKVNVVLSPRKHDRFQLDGDTTICLSDFGIDRPSSLLGLIGTKDEALIRLLLWATPDGAPLDA
jgi:polyisoprenoid-binding protein YceI